jgi:hypothetical protein
MLYFLLIVLVDSKQIIKNINVPSCRNCIYYKPPYYGDYSASYSKCNKFATKDVITDQIVYDFADTSRKNEDKCGNEGKYFELEKNVEFKIFIHQIILELHGKSMVIVIGGVL